MLSCIVECGENDIKNQSAMLPCAVSTVKNSQLTDFDHCSYLIQKFSYSRRVQNNRLATLCNILETFIYTFIYNIFVLELQIQNKFALVPCK